LFAEALSIRKTYTAYDSRTKNTDEETDMGMEGRWLGEAGAVTKETVEKDRKEAGQMIFSLASCCAQLGGNPSIFKPPPLYSR